VPSRRYARLIATLRRVLQPGDRLPDVTVFDTDVRPIRLPEFAAEGPLLLAFYLYDWTGT
jgi:peroxiredoxin